ncbi:MAG: glycerol kinase, partial [Gemmatimonadetes bacterium]|nr:glycerol kinase [Gemmatimonadota bacterium]
ADAVTPLSQLRVDGGAAANDLLMQFQADLLQVPVLRPQTQETTALGAAYLAGLASGYWHTLDELSSQWQVSRIYEPGISPTMAAALRSRWSEAVDRSRRWATPE